jgi:hypothetical protein
MPDRSKVMTQTKRYGLPGWGLGMGLTTPPRKKSFVEKLLTIAAGRKHLRRPSKNKDLETGDERHRIETNGEQY